MAPTSLLRRLLLPSIVLLTVGLSMLVLFAGGSSGASSPADNEQVISSTITGANSNGDTSGANEVGRPNSGSPNSTLRVYDAKGQLVSYGNSDITYTNPPAALIPLGEALYAQNCASCHGVHADGVAPNNTPGGYPNLLGLGPATIDFWIVSGRMPAADTTAVQANRKASRLTPTQALAVAAYVNSLSPATPYVPTVHNLSTADRSNGFALFSLNCAACHTITGGGDALAQNTYAPSLRNIPAYQVAEAIRIGPGNMPVFTGNLSDAQVRDIVAYVTGNIQHPVNPGGFGLGGLGPVAEGFVGLALGIGLLALIAFWIGDRT
jgi:ubiquinol-cytochrome c reductase cytochrome c subunit